MNAGIWAFLMRITMRAAQIVRVIILGRLLSPDDFGLMAIATITLGLLEVFSQTGYRQALVQREGDIDDALDTAWSVEILRGAVVGVAVLVGAPLIGLFYDQPDVVSIVRVMSLVALISGFTNMAIVKFDRDLRFNKIFRFHVTQRLTEVVVSIGVALVWPSVWALVVGAISGAIARVASSFVLAPYRPRFGFVGSEVRRLTSFGKWIYGTNVLFYLSSEADDILVGRMLGAGSLGLYRMAFTLSQSVVTEIAQTVNQVMFPAFSKIQASQKRLAESLLQSTHFVVFLAFPISALFVVMGDEIVQVLLGDSWLGMVTALKILAVAGAIRTLGSVALIMFEGVGQPHIATRFGAIKLAVIAVTIVPLINNYGINGAALSSLAASSVLAVLILPKIRAFSHGRFPQFVRSVAWPLANSLVMAVVMLGVRGWNPAGSAFLTLLIAIAAGGAAYLMAALVSARFFGYRQPGQLLANIKERSRDESTNEDESPD